MTNYFSPTTLRDFKQVGHSIHPYCSHYRVCTHSALLSVDYLAKHLGWEFDLYSDRDELLRRLTCSKCGWRRPVIVLSNQNNATGAGGHTHGPPVPFEEAVHRALEMGTGSHAGGRRCRRWGRR
jgi:hypothetical protein